MAEMLKETHEQLVIFHIKGQNFGVNIENVQEIIKSIPITYVPRTQEYIKGVINLRGKIIPVVDLYKRLKIKKTEEIAEWRLVILEVGDLVVGVVVDEVSEVLSIKEDDIEKGIQLAIGLDSKFIQGIGKQDETLIIILNLKNVLDLECGLENLSEVVG